VYPQEVDTLTRIMIYIRAQSIMDNVVNDQGSWNEGKVAIAEIM